MVTDQDLSTLRARVIHLEGQVAFLYKHLGVTFVPEVVPGDDPKVIEALKKGNLLEAIKVYRGITGASYEDGKNAVEEMKGRLGI
ncbi:MAG: hypothetical protein H7Y59_06430 [Anaerolineales bacterium]|nr:hypothetical protein [Anaerolineales bacterium]